MKKIIISLTCFAFILTLSNCATIVSKSIYPLSINSSPSEAKIVVTDKSGKEVYVGQTPAVVDLKAGSGYFGKAQYYVKFEKSGYDSKTVPVNFKLDGWYFGNLLFGGFIGLLVVDPLTGAMYKIDKDFLNETLSSTTAYNPEKLNIYSMNDIPSEWKNHLILVKQHN